MPWSDRSAERLATVHPDLRRLFDLVDARGFECSILEGRRDRETQNEYFRQGLSQLEWPDSAHNVEDPDGLAEAVDVAPWPIDWNDRERFVFFAGVVEMAAAELGIPIRWGGDWDDDGQMTDETFRDLVHFELDEEPST